MIDTHQLLLKLYKQCLHSTGRDRIWWEKRATTIYSYTRMTFNHYFLEVAQRIILRGRKKAVHVHSLMLSWLSLMFTQWWSRLMFYNNKLHNVCLRRIGQFPCQKFPTCYRVHVCWPLFCFWRICVGSGGGEKYTALPHSLCRTMCSLQYNMIYNTLNFTGYHLSVCKPLLHWQKSILHPKTLLHYKTRKVFL